MRDPQGYRIGAILLQAAARLIQREDRPPINCYECVSHDDTTACGRAVRLNARDDQPAWLRPRCLNGKSGKDRRAVEMNRGAIEPAAAGVRQQENCCAGRRKKQ
jgi:hypothetical protein